jgi:site-specific DNA recombinase
MMGPGAAGGLSSIRCAIYTRKSSEEGLEQDFNSLHAQREACAAYVLSQASEGWILLPGVYDDGGLSGGTLERPALQCLLADIAAGKIDIVVVYKVDRLTRSLIDFARLVEAFDAAGTSFVSVTQSFNTTTSMGRLTLNMLLSFAQFEREVTAERIRDKIAASKAKGMWMGGTVPLGYRANGRSLAVVDRHADLVRHIYARYLALGNVRHLAEELEAQGIKVPHRRTGTGKQLGGGLFSRGQIHAILTNPVYTGLIAHKGKLHPGQHPAIIAREQWDLVQAQLAANRQGTRSGRTGKESSVLAGRIVDGQGEALVAAHATKRIKGRELVRYRYYVSRTLQHGQRANNEEGLRLPAGEVEAVVASILAEALDDPLGLAGQAGLIVEPGDLKPLRSRAANLAAELRRREWTNALPLMARVQIHQRRVDLELDGGAMATHFQMRRAAHGAPTLILHHEVRLTRTGRAMRLIDGRGASAARAEPDAGLVRLVLRARRWWQELGKGELTVTELARKEGLTRSYLVRVLRLAFLSPRVVEAILEGRLRADIDASALTRTHAIDPDWHKQERMLLAR